MSEGINTKTLPETAILFNWAAIDEIEFAVSFLKQAQKAYRLDKVTNGHIKSDISISDIHPIAILETQKGDQSRLPIIGVEQVQVSPDQMILGANQSAAYVVTSEFIDRLDAITPENRMFAPDFTAHLRSLLEERGSNPLYVYRNTMIERTSLQISAWSQSSEANRYIKKFLKSVMIEFYRAIQKHQVKPEMYSMSPNLYNFDYGETIYGCELELPFLMPNANYIVDIGLTELRHFDIGMYDSDATLYNAEHVAWFTVAGAKDKLRFGNESVITEPV